MQAIPFRRFVFSSGDIIFSIPRAGKENDNYIADNGPSIISTRYANLGHTKFRKSENACKSVLGIDANQLYPFLMTKKIPICLYTKSEFKEDTWNFHPKRIVVF